MTFGTTLMCHIYVSFNNKKKNVLYKFNIFDKFIIKIVYNVTFYVLR